MILIACSVSTMVFMAQIIDRHVCVIREIRGKNGSGISGAARRLAEESFQFGAEAPEIDRFGQHIFGTFLHG